MRSVPSSSVFVINTLSFQCGSVIWRNANFHRLGCLSGVRSPAQHPPAQHNTFGQHGTMGNILFTLLYRQRYCNTCEWPKDLVFLHRRVDIKTVVLVQAEKYIWSSRRIRLCVVHAHEHTEAVFDMEVTMTAQQGRVCAFTLSGQLQKERWYRCNRFPPSLLMCSLHIDFQIMTKVLLCHAR